MPASSRKSKYYLTLEMPQMNNSMSQLSHLSILLILNVCLPLFFWLKGCWRRGKTNNSKLIGAIFSISVSNKLLKVEDGTGIFRGNYRQISTQYLLITTRTLVIPNLFDVSKLLCSLILTDYPFHLKLVSYFLILHLPTTPHALLFN